MKKILVVLSVVAMAFASCTQGDKTLPRPEFPEVNTLSVEAGKSYKITFVAEANWVVSVPAEAQRYAELRYENFTDTSHSGSAGEQTITLHMKSKVGSYFEDITFYIEITMNGYTENLAECTIAKLTKVLTVTGTPNAGFEEEVLSVFSKGGHPENGPFASCENAYSVVHKRGVDAEDGNYVVAHDFDMDYDYVIYGKDASGEFVPVANDSNSWLSCPTFGTNGEKHRLEMRYNASSAVMTEGVGYEAYVNVEDEKKNVVISVYYRFNPADEAVVERTFGLADSALAAEKGIVMDGSGLNYTLTYPSLEVFTNDYMAAAFKLVGYTDIYGGIGSGSNNLVFEHNEESDVWYLRPAEGASLAQLRRTETLTISAVGSSLVSYTINIIFDWVEESSSVADGSVSFVNAEVANQSGATLVKLEATDEDYNAEIAIEHQYKLTYASAALLKTPASTAMVIPGFEMGMIMNINDLEAGHFNYSEALEFAKDAATGDVNLGLRQFKDEDNNIYELDVPAGSCELYCLDGEGSKFARILFVLSE